jgi:hypothetical protein
MPVTQNKAVSAQGIFSASGVVTAAKIVLSGPANAANFFTAGPNGAIIYRITALPAGTIVDTQLQLYRSHDTGVTLQLLGLLRMPAYALAVGTAPVLSDFGYSETVPLRMGPLEQLWIGISVAVATGIVFDLHGEAL